MPATNAVSPSIDAVRLTHRTFGRASIQPPLPARLDLRVPIASSSTLGVPHSQTRADRPELRARALMAQDVYNDRAMPPAGYRVAGEAELAALGLEPGVLAEGDFRARVYATGTGESTRYIIAFRGTQSVGDWVSNLRQGVGLGSEHYTSALRIAERVARSGHVGQVEFTGHSLGGGLASAAAIASGRPAQTFNAAGLHEETIEAADAQREVLIGGRAGAVDAWYVRGEILSVVQEGGDRMIGALFGGMIGGALADAPSAYGRRIGLDAVAPEDKSWLQRHNPVDRHGMDWVLMSLPH